MHKLLIATRNKDKLQEIKQILSDDRFELCSLDDMGIAQDLPETGKTFEENAILKATTAGEKTGLLTLADDSGLEVDALNGRPGIYSARYTSGSDQDRIEKVLHELVGIPQEKRTAQFASIIALYDPKTKRINTFEGICQGYITDHPIGKHGFGYDPIFWSRDFGKTFGEATDEEKEKVSHRGRALKKLREYLMTNNQ